MSAAPHPILCVIHADLQADRRPDPTSTFAWITRTKHPPTLDGMTDSTGSTPPTSPGKAFAIYSALRLALLVVSFAVLRVILGDGKDLLVIGAAVLLSAMLSLVLLKKQRDEFARASLARAEERRAAKATRRARLDETGTSPDKTGA